MSNTEPGSSENPEILHQKYSVHMSPNSPEFSTIVHTLWLSDGRKLLSRALTDAVKSKKGFFHIFSRRCSDLSPARYDVPESDGAQRLELASVIENFTLIYSVFVGHSSSTFGPQPNTSVIEFAFSEFKIIVLSAYIPLPPHHTGYFLHNLTFRPEIEDIITQGAMRDLMRGTSAAETLDSFRDRAILLASQFATALLAEVKEPHLVAYLNDFLKQIPAPKSDTILLLDHLIRIIGHLPFRSNAGRLVNTSGR